jgi:hypothetical protein
MGALGCSLFFREFLGISLGDAFAPTATSSVVRANEFRGFVAIYPT